MEVGQGKDDFPGGVAEIPAGDGDWRTGSAEGCGKKQEK